MSSAVQLKLLTLLNVSAIKRPFDLDVPGGHRSSPTLSRETSLTPQQPAATITTTTTTTTTSTSNAGSINSRGTDGEPPKKKKKGVIFGGVIGPSGSTIKSGEVGSASGSTSGSGSGSAEKKGKKNKDKKRVTSSNPADEVSESLTAETSTLTSTSAPFELEAEESSDDDDAPTSSTSTSKTPTTSDADAFQSHFAITPSILDDETREAAEAHQWTSRRRVVPGLGRVVDCLPKGQEEGQVQSSGSSRITPSLLTPYKALHPNPSDMQNSALQALGGYKDVYLHGVDREEEVERVRGAAMLHAVNHVLKTRRKIIRNNEKLAHAQASSTPLPDSFDPRDQSFTRPKVLLLLPFRSWALHYLVDHLFPLAPKDNQIENLRPFVSSFSLPEGVEDPLTESDKGKNYPKDHVQTFAGNSDDNFRFGIKFTRKAWRVVLPPANEDKLIGCDIIVASPLAIRMASDKEGGVDSLSSIEVVVADGLDVMAMQNWEHVQFVFQNMNKVPNNPHGCDFSRVKPWYLDNQAKFLRQSILISRYDTPEFRSLFNKSLFNVQGKIRVERTDFEGVLGNVRKGVKQVFTRLRGEDALEELEIRFKMFTETTLPALMKSAVSSSNTLIVVPSYFDFVRVTGHMRKMDKISFAAISEYSSNQEISAARTGFFKGKKSFLVITERFHFYRRYRLRGAKTIVFYALPEHAEFYAEFMASPFLPSATGKQTIDIDEAEVTSRVAYSKFDYLKLERIVGTENAKRMVTEDESKFTFV